MRSTPPKFDPIHSSSQMAELIASVTGRPVAEALGQLRAEFDDPGSTVAADFEARGIERYRLTPGMTRFYSETDAFLFELAVWNRNAIKRLMLARILAWTERYRGRGLDVLSIGDGLGFDCLQLRRAGHRVTYFELPGKTEACARRVFQAAGADDVRVLTDPAALQPGSCDVLVCLDTLEHVPDPATLVGQFAAYLRPGGLLFVHAPFYMIHRRYPTHLRTSRRYSGSTKLFTDHGFRPIDGEPFWSPLVLAKADAAGRYPTSPLARRLMVHFGGAALSAGRVGLLPLRVVHAVRRHGNRWFDKGEADRPPAPTQA